MEVVFCLGFFHCEGGGGEVEGYHSRGWVDGGSDVVRFWKSVCFESDGVIGFIERVRSFWWGESLLLTGPAGLGSAMRIM